MIYYGHQGYAPPHNTRKAALEGPSTCGSIVEGHAIGSHNTDTNRIARSGGSGGVVWPFEELVDAVFLLAVRLALVELVDNGA
jgi:hypothetical protein